MFNIGIEGSLDPKKLLEDGARNSLVEAIPELSPYKNDIGVNFVESSSEFEFDFPSIIPSDVIDKVKKHFNQ